MIFYHGSTSKHINSILRSGIKTFGGGERSACVTRDKGTAASYAYEEYSDFGQYGKPVVFTLNIPKQYLEKVYGPDEWQLSESFIRRHGNVIPPKYIVKVESVEGEKGMPMSQVEYEGLHEI